MECTNIIGFRTEVIRKPLGTKTADKNVLQQQQQLKSSFEAKQFLLIH